MPRDPQGAAPVSPLAPLNRPDQPCTKKPKNTIPILLVWLFRDGINQAQKTYVNLNALLIYFRKLTKRGQNETEIIGSDYPGKHRIEWLHSILFGLQRSQHVRARRRFGRQEHWVAASGFRNGSERKHHVPQRDIEGRRHAAVGHAYVIVDKLQRDVFTSVHILFHKLPAQVRSVADRYHAIRQGQFVDQGGFQHLEKYLVSKRPFPSQREGPELPASHWTLNEAANNDQRAVRVYCPNRLQCDIRNNCYPARQCARGQTNRNGTVGDGHSGKLDKNVPYRDG